MAPERRRRHPLLGPWWISAHVIVLLIAVTFPQLALWQFRRLGEERTLAAAQAERLDAVPTDLAAALGADAGGGPVPPRFDEATLEVLQFTPVVVEGTWLGDQQVAQRNRSYGGQGGFDLLTPLAIADGPLAGTAVVVRRGWVPTDGPGSADPLLDVPVDGPVVVTGFLQSPTSQPNFGPRDAPDTTLTTVFHADVDRLAEQVDRPLVGVIVWLTTQQPDDGELPLPQPPPARDTSQNLSYALQWSAFTLIVVGGYLLVLRRRVRDHRAGIDSDVDPLLRGRTGR